MARRKLEVQKQLSRILPVSFAKLPHRNYLLSGAIILLILVAGFAVMQLHLFNNGNITKPAIAFITAIAGLVMFPLLNKCSCITANPATSMSKIIAPESK